MEELVNKKADIKSIQIELLEMLKWLVGICVENNITYYLAGGTLLGAVRHQGFIPWDDDVDIMLPRESYNRLLAVCMQSVPENYELKSLKIDNKYKYPYAKLENKSCVIREYVNKEPSYLWIDIFPVDGTPNNYIMRNVHLKVLGILKFIRWEADTLNHYYKRKWKLWIKVFLFWPCILYGSSNISILIDKLAQKYRFNDTDVVACVVGKYNKKECIKREDMEYGFLACFEGLQVRIPNGYNRYLTALYGEYMKLPSVKSRENHIVQ